MASRICVHAVRGLAQQLLAAARYRGTPVEESKKTKPRRFGQGFACRYEILDQSIGLKLNSPPSRIPEGQREVMVLVRV